MNYCYMIIEIQIMLMTGLCIFTLTTKYKQTSVFDRRVVLLPGADYDIAEVLLLSSSMLLAWGDTAEANEEEDDDDENTSTMRGLGAAKVLSALLLSRRWSASFAWSNEATMPTMCGSTAV